MTTYDEISTCPEAHREFFTARARLNLLEYQDHLKTYGKDNGFTKLAKSGFRSNMRERREQTYLDRSNDIKKPEWWDDDLHGTGLEALTDEWVTLGELKRRMGEWGDRATEIMRDLVGLGLAEAEDREVYRAHGSLAGGKTYYRLPSK